MFIAAGRIVAAFVSHIGLALAKMSGFTGPGPVGNKRSKISLKSISAKAVSLTLIISILASTTPAVATNSTAMLVSIRELNRDISHFYLTNFSGTSSPGAPAAAAASLSFSSLMDFVFAMNPVLGFAAGRGIFKKGAKRQDRPKPAVARVEITPNRVVIREGEQVAFAGRALDAQGNNVPGTQFIYKAIDRRQRTPLKVLPNGLFEPIFPGDFIVTAEVEGGGLSASTSVKVIKDAQSAAMKKLMRDRVRDRAEAAAAGDRSNARGRGVNSKETSEIAAQPLPAPVEYSSTRPEPLSPADVFRNQRPLPRENRPQPPGNPQYREPAPTNINPNDFLRRNQSTTGFTPVRDEASRGTVNQSSSDQSTILAPDTGNGGGEASEADNQAAGEISNSPEGERENARSEIATAVRAFQPEGVMDGVSGSGRYVWGWSFDPDSSPTSLQIHFYIDGPAGTGTWGGYTYADKLRADVNSAFGITGNHGYEFSIPNQFYDGNWHTIYAYGIDHTGDNNRLLGGAPLWFNFSPNGDPNWGNPNAPTADDPGVQPGDPPGDGTDGAGSSNFSFSAPVVALGGRGDLGVNLSLNYNSLVWHKAGSEIIFDIDKGFPAPGWSIGLGKIMDMGNASGFMLEGLDGTRHAYEGTIQPGWTYGYLTYYGRTTDGSFIDYVVTRTPSGITAASAYLPNGTRVDYGAYSDGAAYPTYIEDRHGNYMTVTYRNGQGPEIDTIRDAMGREVKFNYDDLSRLVSITGPAQNWQTRTLIRIHYRPLTLNYAFSSGLTPLVRRGTVDVIDAIYYPVTNNGYWFGDANSYSTYGMIAKVSERKGMSWSGAGNHDQGTVTGGAMMREMSYDYPLTPSANLTGAPHYANMTEDWYQKDTPGPAVTNYNIQNNPVVPNPRVTTITLPTTTNPVPGGGTPTTTPGNKIKQYSYNQPGDWKDGLLFKVEVLSPTNQVLSRTETSWELGDYSSPRVTQVLSTDEKNQTAKRTFAYGLEPYNQVVEAAEYGYTNNLLRKKVTTYENGANYRGYYNGTTWTGGRHIFSLVKSEQVFDASNALLSKVDYNYDQSALADAPNVVMYQQNHNPYTTQTMQGPNCVAWGEETYYDEGGNPQIIYVCTAYEQISIFDSATLARGNVTETITYSDVNNQSQTAIPYNSTYDITGNARTVTTNCCQQMVFHYAKIFEYAFPHATTKGHPTDTNLQMTESAWYDFNTGLQSSATDFNGRITWFGYDAANRLDWVGYPTGAQKDFWYNDGTDNTYVVAVYEAGTYALASHQNFSLNGRGQTKFANTYAPPTPAIPNFWDPANFSTVHAKYDETGRKTQETLPYSGSQTQVWTIYQYDALSRVTQVTAPDGSQTQTFYNESQKPGSALTTAGQTVRSRDAWGRERWARTDDFGRLVEVVEPNPTTTGGIFEPGSLQTAYTYDALDQLVRVDQGAQVRKFRYDSMGRLVRQKLAEATATINDAGAFVPAPHGGAQWSDSFTYDNRSNLTTRTDARGVVTTFHYNGDALNRLQMISYNKSGADTAHPIHDASPVTLEYETAGDKTRVKKVTTWSTVEENVYDVESRVAQYKVTFSSQPAQPLVTNYAYDTVSRLTQVIYPNQYGMAGLPRKEVKPGYDASSRLKELKVDNQIQMSEIVYNPMQQVTNIKTGAATPNPDVEQYSYDPQTGLLTNQKVFKANNPGQMLLNLDYFYNRGNSSGTSANPNAKTGQLTKIVDHVNQNRSRLYEYDALGRLWTAKGGASVVGSNNATANWIQNYAYDRYGNRLGATVAPQSFTQDGQPVPADGLSGLNYDQTSNRISGYTYDLAGSLVRGQKPDGAWQRYEYDAAGRLVRVWRDSDGFLEEGNEYAATRQRTKTWSWASTQVRHLVWGGQSVVAEYTGGWDANNPLSWQKSYVYAGSRLLCTYAKNGSAEDQQFHHPDRLGTRLVTNNQANTSFEQNTLPFGTALSGESTGSTNQRFTSYDRNTVANLDYAVNRSYSTAQGRFTTVDPIGMDATELTNPQSMNLYAYVENNPVDFVDPSGLLLSIHRFGTCSTFIIPEGESFRTVTVCFTDNWSTPDPGTGGGEPGVGGGGNSGPGESTQPSDCRRFVNGLMSIFQGLLNAGLSTANIGRWFLAEAYAKTIGGDEYSRTAHPVGGFRGELIDGTQLGHVYRHILGHAGATLIGTDYVSPGGLFTAPRAASATETGFQLSDREMDADEAQLREDPTRRRQSMAELEGDRAGRAIGSLFRHISNNSIMERDWSKYKQQVFDILCEE